MLLHHLTEAARGGSMREIYFDSRSPMGKTPHLNNVGNILAFSLRHNCEEGGLRKVVLLDFAVMESDCRTCNDRFWAEMIIQSLMIFTAHSQESDARHFCLPLVGSYLSSCFQSWFRAAINPEEAPINEGWWNYAHKYEGFQTRALWKNSESPFVKLVNSPSFIGVYLVFSALRLSSS